MKRLGISLGWMAIIACCVKGEAVTNLYHFPNAYRPQVFSLGSPPQYLELMLAADSMSGIERASDDVTLLTGSTHAVEYEGIAVGYTNAEEAWNQVVSCVQNQGTNYDDVYYDNAGWVVGTKQVQGEWGAAIWYLQNSMSFYSSTSSWFVGAHGATSEISCVIVGSLGVYNPQTLATEVGPEWDWQFVGSNVMTSAVFRADISTYYRLVANPYWTVNDADLDQDGIPGFADGFNRDQTGGNADDHSLEPFHAWKLSLYNVCIPTQAIVRIRYDASDPSQVSFNGTNYSATGSFRLWKKNGPGTRDPRSCFVYPAGDYIPPCTNTASNLGFTDAAESLAIYVEPITPSANFPILFEVDPDGPGGTRGFVKYAQIKSAIIKIDFKTNELIRPLYEQTLDAETWLTDDTFDKTRITWTITKMEGMDATIDQDGDITFGQGAGIYTVRAESSDLSTCYDEFTLMVIDWVLGAHSNVGDGADFLSGHAWISVTDFSQSSTPVTRYGLWPDGHPLIIQDGLSNGDGTDVRFNREPAYGLHNRYFFLNPTEKQALINYINTVYHWTYWYTCASFAEGSVMAATGEDLDADDYLGFETPREFGSSINQLETADPTARINPVNGGNVNSSWVPSSFEGSVHDP